MSIDRAIAAFAPALPLAVAFSGGADSTALLLACAQRWPGQVEALHVHHGLQQAGDDFETHCRAICAGWDVPLRVARVDARHAPGESPEDAARRSRYAALLDMANQSPRLHSLALGQHADDQVETLLLALSRGAGVAGLAAMPAHTERLGLALHRPLLAVTAPEIRTWLCAREVPWIEDPSNADGRYLRNRIRAELLPAIEGVFPHFRSTFARSSRHAAQASELLEALAAIDLLQVGAPPAIRALQALTRARQANVLRHWLRQAHGATPSEAQLDQLLNQVRACTTRGHDLRLKVGHGFVVRKGTTLDWYNFAPPSLPSR